MAVDGMPVIDFHAHVGAWPKYGMVGVGDDLVATMDAAGVDRACVFNIFHGDARRGNDETARLVEGRRDRFFPFAFVTPHYPNEMQPELDRAFDELGFRGIKIYPPYAAERPLDHADWEPAFRTAHERRVPVLVHTWGGSPLCRPGLCVSWAQRYPDAAIVLGHAGGPRAGRREAIDAADQADNVYLEIASSYRDCGSIEEMVAGVGPERVLFGSDMMLLEPALHIGRVLLADVSDEAKRLILGGNAARLLGVDP